MTTIRRPSMRNRHLGAATLVAALIVPLGCSAFGQSSDATTAHALIANAEAAAVGAVTWTQRAGTVTVQVDVHGLAPGFHGFHVHAVGECVAPFTSAGPHLNPEAVDHPEHAADQPVLLVNADGTGSATFVTDRYSVADIVGAAVIIHANPDNYANIPDRYLAPAPSASSALGASPAASAAPPSPPDTSASPVLVPGPDPMTLATGDSGSRIACGVIQSGPAAAGSQ
jgi:Cu-Zn family superoxide dismutase